MSAAGHAQGRRRFGMVLGWFHVAFLGTARAAVGHWRSSPMSSVAIDETGLVTIVAHRSEMGTGIKTDLPLIVADELEADWAGSRWFRRRATNDTATRTPMARAAPAILPGHARGRCYGAPDARGGAAATWRVPAVRVPRGQGTVIHVRQRRRLPFGELVALRGAARAGSARRFA